MNKQLLILRHAKSDWSANYNRDIERPLNTRGKNDAGLIGSWIAEHHLEPDYILCSPAKRTRSTIDNLSGHIEITGIQTVYPNVLYLADLDTLLTIIRNAPEPVQRLLLVGHNPGLEELLCYLSNQPIPLTTNGKLFTTANLAVLEIPGSFNQVKQHSAVISSLVRPADLRG